MRYSLYYISVGKPNLAFVDTIQLSSFMFGEFDRKLYFINSEDIKKTIISCFNYLFYLLAIFVTIILVYPVLSKSRFNVEV